MHFVLFFLVLTPFLADVQAMTEDQKKMIREHFEAVGAECMADNPVTEDDINALRSKAVPPGDGAPCFVACLMRKIGVMDDAGMLQKESGLELAKKVFNDEEELKIIEDYLHSCSGVNAAAVSDGAKGCDRAMLAYKCMTENALKFGIDV